MRAGSVCSPLLVLNLFSWLLSVSIPCYAQFDGLEPIQKLASSDPLEKPTHPFDEKDVTKAVKDSREKLKLNLEPIEKLASFDLLQSPEYPFTPKDITKAMKEAREKLKLGPDDFLGSGLKRKSVAGAYGTTAGVAVGGAAIGYQLMNLQTKNRVADTKKAKDMRVKAAICAAQQQKQIEQMQEAENPTSSQSNVRPWYGVGQGYRYPPSRARPNWEKRALDDVTLNTIEDYNKMIAGSEAIASGSIAVTTAQQEKQRSLDASSEFEC